MIAIIDRLLSAILIIAFMQIPAFIQTYIQILAGHVAELNYQLNLYREAASNLQKTLPDLVSRFLNINDPDIHAIGVVLKQLSERADKLNYQLNLLTGSSAWQKPFHFISNIDFTLARESWDQFQLGLPLTLESFTYGGVGLLFGFVISRCLFSRSSNENRPSHTQ